MGAPAIPLWLTAAELAEVTINTVQIDPALEPLALCYLPSTEKWLVENPREAAQLLQALPGAKLRYAPGLRPTAGGGRA